MAGTSWNPSDSAAGITLTGSNLIATAANNNLKNIRAVDSHAAGKYYYEMTWNTATGSFLGLMSAAYSLTGPCGATGTTGFTSIQNNGTIYVNGTNQSMTLTGVTSGVVVCIAFDADTKRVWYRNGAAGNWNNSGTANPATGVGGALTTLGGAIPAYPMASLSTLNNQVTANFGDSAFTGAVPSGFTSGWPTGADVIPGGGAGQARVAILA